MRVFRQYILCLMMALGILFFCHIEAAAAGEGLVIALDPGHGGDEDGAYYYGIKEKDVNLTMARFVKRELEQYENVTVVLTRERDEVVGLSERANRAKQAGADILISLHFNASNSHQSQGASVYISTGEANRQTLQDFADYLLGEFEALGLQNAGTFARVTQMGARRQDGSFDDYYGVIRHAYNNGMPAMIIEHCYMDHREDRQFLRSEEGLSSLAKADANGIAAYYGLKRKDGKQVKAKHAAKYGATTKAVELNYFEAPRVTGIRLLSYDGKTPGIATYEVQTEDSAGISSMYLVYKNAAGSSVTVSLRYGKSLTTGVHQVTAYIPEYLSIGNYTLSYIGAYNAAGFDAGYNYSNGSMAGFGKCDWLNSFAYYGEADYIVEQEGSISTAHAKMIDYEIQIGIRDRRNIYPVSVYPN